MRRILIISGAVAAVIAVSVICFFALRPEEPPVSAVSASDIRVTDGNASRGDFIAMCMYLYEQLSGNAVPLKETNGVNKSENVKKAYALGVIGINDAAVYSGDSALTREEAAVLLYNVMVRYDPSVVMNADEVNAALNDCYDNMSLLYRDACAFALRSGAAESGCSFYPSSMLTSAEAADWINRVYSLYKKEHSISFVNGKTVSCGDTGATLIKTMGMPSRIDTSFYGGETYIYNTASVYAAVYVDRGAVRGFFSNLGVKESTDTFGDLKNGGGAFYRADTVRTDKSTAVMREKEQKEFFEMLSAYRRAQGMGALYEQDTLVMMAEENSRSVSGGGRDMDIPGKCASVRGESAEDMYIQLVTSAKYKNALNKGRGKDCYAGAGLWYGSVEPCVTVIIDEQTAVNPEDRKQEKPSAYTTPKPVYTNEAPVLASPVNEQRLAAGTPIDVKLEKRTSESFILRAADAETGETVVYARIYGDSAVIAPSALEEGTDYMITASTDAGGEELFSETAAVRCGEPEKPVITAPHINETIDTEYITISWKSRYSDFLVTLYNEAGETLASERIAGANELRADGLTDGLYTAEVSAYRKDTNVIMASQSSKFLVQSGGISVTRTERPAVDFSRTRYSSVFGGSLVYSSKQQADSNMTTVKVPVWKLDSTGEKSSSFMSVTVNKAVAQQVIEIFEEIYNGSEKFPIKSLSGYNWRSTATGTRSQHSYGTCIDINPEENYCIYNSGRVIGSYWKPEEDPYSIRPDGDVVRAFKSRGWTWGAQWSSLKDYMHFSYLGG